MAKRQMTDDARRIAIELAAELASQRAADLVRAQVHSLLDEHKDHDFVVRDTELDLLDDEVYAIGCSTCCRRISVTAGDRRGESVRLAVAAMDCISRTSRHGRGRRG